VQLRRSVLVPVVGSETAGDGEIRDKATVETLLLS
jgi:hypothetical protein